MSIFKSPLSPQQLASHSFQGAYRSEKIQKSRNSLLDGDHSDTLVKDCKMSQFNQDETSIFHKGAPSLNQTRLAPMTGLNRGELQQEEAALQEKECCYCKTGGENLLQICQCSLSHQECANQAISQGPLPQAIMCQTCKEYRQVSGVIRFDGSRWKGSLPWLLLELMCILGLLGLLGVMTFLMVREEDVNKDRLIISCLVFSYTVGFILLVCLLTKMVNHFRTVEYRIRKYDSRNVALNKQYVELIIKP